MTASGVPQPASPGARPRVAVGTSGFAYDAWRGIFYPEDLSSKRFLSYYAQHFSTTEINATFYRFPRTNVVEEWARQVPAGFLFTLKMSQRVTHAKRLQDVDREMGWFCDGAYTLGDKLGAVLVQLPPNFRKDAPRLDAFLSKHAARLPLAVEFRHDSWFDDEVFGVLGRHRTALAVVEMDDGDALARPRLVTGSFAYVRLRKGDYTDGELGDWAEWMRAQTVPVFCYLKHEELGPALARRLAAQIDPRSTLAAGSSAPKPPATAPARAAVRRRSKPRE
jgi:uncharacterized protein YecE (DUF72 family)